MDVAGNFDFQSLTGVRGLIWLRERLLRAPRTTTRQPMGLLAETGKTGWGVLADEPGRVIVRGAVCQPWRADVVFTPIPPERFAAYAEPDLVKIAWTLEAEALGPETTRFAHETRAVATDAAARAKFMRYWRWARFGIVGIRLLLMPAIRRAAERRWSGRTSR
ncbi:MAG TPA: hypothetical protein VL332_05805 [Candidatus Saccharimonadaceae bacterium]|jgi:hypothetical protein|nr:hypothetical protein [Candidatus Saccharimonadaceae bacterium]